MFATFRFVEHARPAPRACSYESRFARVPYSQMYSCARWRSDVANRTGRRTGSRNLDEHTAVRRARHDRHRHLPVSPSFLLQVSQVHRLRFFFSVLVFSGDAPRREDNQCTLDRQGTMVLLSELLSAISESIFIDESRVVDIVGADATCGRGLACSSGFN